MSSTPTPTRTTGPTTLQAARPASLSARRRPSGTARSPSVRPLPTACLRPTADQRRRCCSPSSSRARRASVRLATRRRLSVTIRSPSVRPLPAACLRPTVDQRRRCCSPSSNHARRASVRRPTRQRLSVTVRSPSVRPLPAACLRLTANQKRRRSCSPSSSHARRTSVRLATRRRLSVTIRSPSVRPLPAACLRPTADQRRRCCSPSSNRARRASVRRATRRRLSVTVRNPSVRPLTGSPTGRLPRTRSWKRSVAPGRCRLGGRWGGQDPLQPREGWLQLRSTHGSCLLRAPHSSLKSRRQLSFFGLPKTRHRCTMHSSLRSQLSLQRPHLLLSRKELSSSRGLTGNLSRPRSEQILQLLHLCLQCKPSTPGLLKIGVTLSRHVLQASPLSSAKR